MTNQYGLSIDSIVGYNLVLPNGTIAYVTKSTYPDLFFGLKGGYNNFVSCCFLSRHRLAELSMFQGIVTDFTMTAFPQSDIWVRTVHSVTVRRQGLDFISGWTNDLSHSRVWQTPKCPCGFLGSFPGHKSCSSCHVRQLWGEHYCRPEHLL